MKFRIKPFVFDSINWAKRTMLTFFFIYGGIGIVSLMLFYNFVLGGGADTASYGMNYFSTFMIFIFINGIIMGSSRHSYDVWLSIGMTRKEIIAGYAVQIAIMSGLVVLGHIIMTSGFSLAQSILFGEKFSSMVKSEYFMTMYKLNPLTYVFAGFFMSYSTTAIGFLIGNAFGRWKKIMLGLILLGGALFFLAMSNLLRDPQGTLQILQTVFKPVDMFFNYYGGDHNAITVGINNLVISVVSVVLGYVMTIKRIARIN